MALEAVNRKSKIVVHNSATDLVDKTPLEGYQGAALEDVVNFEKIVDDLSGVTKTDARAQALKYGESFFQITAGNNGAVQYVCTGEYGKTLKKGIEFVAGSSTVAYTGSGGSSANDKLVTGGSAVTTSDVARVDVVIDSNNNTVTSVTVDRRGTNYKAGDVLTITGDLLGGASPADDITITLHQNDLNNAEIITVTLSDI